MPTQAELDRLRDAWRSKLAIYNFTHLVTLSSNHRVVGIRTTKDRLRAWDARMNRWLVGREWARRLDERMDWFAFVEKANVNPHWHLLVELDPEADTGRLEARAEEFADQARMAWMELFPAGSCDVQPLEDRGAVRYVAKVLNDPLNYERLVLSREFVTK